jgi:hypothetical protein
MSCMRQMRPTTSDSDEMSTTGPHRVYTPQPSTSGIAQCDSPLLTSEGREAESRKNQANDHILHKEIRHEEFSKEGGGRSDGRYAGWR